MKRFIYKCSNGNGTYSVGNIIAKDKNEAEKKLELKFHNILTLEEFNPNGFEKTKAGGQKNI